MYIYISMYTYNYVYTMLAFTNMSSAHDELHDVIMN